MKEPRTYTWESLPEFIATMQYSRCLGRVLASLPRAVLRDVQRMLPTAAVEIAVGITGANADVPRGRKMSVVEREDFRDRGLAAVARSRRRLLALRQQQVGSPADIAAALELLERVEHGLASWQPPAPAAAK